MITLQGFTYAELAKAPFSSATRTPDPVSIVTYVAAQSAGMKFAAPQNHPKEKATFAAGKEIFFYRAGSYDFSCASCHGVDGQRIRTQPLPNFTRPDKALAAVQGWPGYRMTGGVMHSLQWRLTDCFRQQRFPKPDYTSETLSALISYVTVNSNGQVYKGPGIKR
jgi:sulfur-oxidizing protein SoxA